MLRDLILKNRSYRRFHEEVPISDQTLRDEEGVHHVPKRSLDEIIVG